MQWRTSQDRNSRNPHKHSKNYTSTYLNHLKNTLLNANSFREPHSIPDISNEPTKQKSATNQLTLGYKLEGAPRQQSRRKTFRRFACEGKVKKMYAHHWFQDNLTHADWAWTRKVIYLRLISLEGPHLLMTVSPSYSNITYSPNNLSNEAA